jgi:hypothetical protein
MFELLLLYFLSRKASDLPEVPYNFKFFGSRKLFSGFRRIRKIKINIVIKKIKLLFSSSSSSSSFSFFFVFDGLGPLELIWNYG